MEKTSEFLIYLMACSLQGTKPEEALLANIDMEALLRLAKAHSVSAMVCIKCRNCSRMVGLSQRTQSGSIFSRVSSPAENGAKRMHPLYINTLSCCRFSGFGV